MAKTEEEERRLLVLESPEKLDRKFGWDTFWLLATPGVAIPIVLIILGWGVGR